MNDTSNRRRWWTQEEDCILQKEVKRQSTYLYLDLYYGYALACFGQAGL